MRIFSQNWLIENDSRLRKGSVLPALQLCPLKSYVVPCKISYLVSGVLYGASSTAKQCLPKDRGKVRNLSISIVSFRISYSLQ